MMRRLVLAALLALAPIGSAYATNCSSNPFTLTNGQTADATQVMANFNNLLNCGNNNLAHNGANSDITSLAGLTTPLSVLQGGTGATTFAANGLIVGNGSSALSTVAPSTSGNMLQSETSGWVSTNVWPGFLPVKSSVLTADLLVIADSTHPWQAMVTSVGNLNLVPARVQTEERQTSGGNGGTSLSGSSWVTRVMNTKTIDTASIGVLSSNTIQLPAGTYDFSAEVMTGGETAGNSHQMRLFDVTNSAVKTDLGGNIIVSHSANAPPSRNILATLNSRFTLSGTTVLRIEEWTNGTSSAGTAAGSGSSELYLAADFFKVS